MIPKSMQRFSDKIMRKQKLGAGWRFEEKPSCSSGGAACAGRAARGVKISTSQVARGVAERFASGHHAAVTDA
jgi:hypothetical protein